MNLNKSMIAGNLTRDPELKTTPSGAEVANFTLAVNRVWKDKNGDKQEDTTFVDVTAWGQQAAQICQYLEKGSNLFVEGRITTESWTNDKGEPRSKQIITLENFKFIGGKNSESSSKGKKAKKGTEDAIGF